MEVLVPELVAEAENRYRVLAEISLTGPIGRRALAEAMNLSERTVRGQVAQLEAMELVDVSPGGIAITSRGEDVLADAAELFRTRHSTGFYERTLTARLHLPAVTVVRGDSRNHRPTQARLAQAGALLVAKRLRAKDVVAVSGGTTLALLAEAMPDMQVAITAVPARGGFGERLETQANAVAAQMARKTGGEYRMLHVPDGFSTAVIELLRKEDASLHEVESLIARANMLVIGVGEALRMAELRQIPDADCQEIRREKAVGEALGYYADATGRIVFHRPNVGVTMDMLPHIPHVIVVAGGSHKATAILAMVRAGIRGHLVTDEGAAEKLTALLSQDRAEQDEEEKHGNKSRN